MPSKTFYTDTSKTDALHLSWGWNWKNMRIRYQGQEIGQCANKKELQQGATFALSPEKELHIRLSNAMTPELELRINGQPVPGTGADSHHILKQLFYMGLILGSLNIAIGIAGELMTNDILIGLGAGIGSIAFGLALVALAFAIRKGSIAAIIASMALWSFDLIALFYFAAESQNSPSTGGLLLKLYFIYYLYRGIAAARKLKEIPKELVVG